MKATHRFSNHYKPLGTRLYLLPTVRVDNWLPKLNFYHVSLVWLAWTWEFWFQ